MKSSAMPVGIPAMPGIDCVDIDEGCAFDEEAFAVAISFPFMTETAALRVGSVGPLSPFVRKNRAGKVSEKHLRGSF